jgi:hypothetical protein
MEGNPILRRVVCLHEISEITTGKNAEVLSVAESTVKARVFRTAKSISRFERAAGNSWPKGSAKLHLDVQEMSGQMRKAALVGAA